MLHFNPRFPRGKRPAAGPSMSVVNQFQSTLPAREATIKALLQDPKVIQFQSTLPAREATD